MVGINEESVANAGLNIKESKDKGPVSMGTNGILEGLVAYALAQQSGSEYESSCIM